jgi:MFS family permease
MYHGERSQVVDFCCQSFGLWARRGQPRPRAACSGVGSKVGKAQEFDFAQGGTLAASSTLVYALMQIPVGYLADRFGARRLFIVGLFGTSLLSLSFALIHVYWLLVLNQAVSGFFRALLFAPGLVLISALFPPNRRAMALGLYVAGGSSSNVLLNLLGPVLVGPLGWRSTVWQGRSCYRYVTLSKSCVTRWCYAAARLTCVAAKR